MEISIKATLVQIEKMGMESLNGLTAMSIKDSFARICVREKA